MIQAVSPKKAVCTACRTPSVCAPNPTTSSAVSATAGMASEIAKTR
jgi:hypothetical protein